MLYLPQKKAEISGEGSLAATHSVQKEEAGKRKIMQQAATPSLSLSNALIELL